MRLSAHRPGLPVRGIAAVSFATLYTGPLSPVHREQDPPAQVLARLVVVYRRPYTGAAYADYAPCDPKLLPGKRAHMPRSTSCPLPVSLRSIPARCLELPTTRPGGRPAMAFRLGYASPYAHGYTGCRTNIASGTILGGRSVGLAGGKESTRR